MSKFLDRESEGWKCARDDLFNRMVNNLQVSKQKYIYEKPTRSSFEEEKLTAAKLEEYENMATRDELTGVYNARYLAHKLIKEVQRAKRYKRPFSLMLISLNTPEQTAAVYGKPVDQEVLRDGASNIVSCVREVDIVGRLAVDQFAVILPETDASKALIVATRISEKMAAMPASQKFNAQPLTTSIGLSSFPTHARDENNLLTTAARYLEQAKNTGLNKVASG